MQQALLPLGHYLSVQPATLSLAGTLHHGIGSALAGQHVVVDRNEVWPTGSVWVVCVGALIWRVSYLTGSGTVVMRHPRELPVPCSKEASCQLPSVCAGRGTVCRCQSRVQSSAKHVSQSHASPTP